VLKHSSNLHAFVSPQAVRLSSSVRRRKDLEQKVSHGVFYHLVMKIFGPIVFLILIGMSYAASKDTPIRIDNTVTQPVLIKKVEPKFPKSLEGKTIKAGIILLEAVVTDKGDVTKVKVLRSMHPLLDKEAVAAVKQWKYKPALKDGKPVSVYFTMKSIIHVK
jgi:protein TonB